jgi:hypothetical protein
MRQFRRGASFHKLDHCTTRPDRNARARIIYTAEKIELRTKLPGKKDGNVSQSGLRVLRALLFQLHNPTIGIIDPSYTAIQARTGLCRDAVADAIKRLETTGIITVLRRLVRQGWRVVQDTNAYLFPSTSPEIPPSLPFRESKNPVKNLISVEPPAPVKAALDKLAESMTARFYEREAQKRLKKGNVSMT